MVRLLFFAAVVILLFGIRIVKPEEWMVVIRSGKYHGFRKQGLHWIVPFLDKTVRVDLNEVSGSWRETSDQILETEVHKWVSEKSAS